MKIYLNNIQNYSASITQLAKELSRLSILRLVAFIVSGIFVTILANERLIAILLMVAPLCALGFSLLIKRYNQFAYLKRHTTFLKEINEDEVSKRETKLSGFPTGQTLINRDHPYTADLDIFGPHSLFQLINRTTTESGNVCLAEWLSVPASKDVILERQQAIQELTPKLEWRQDFQASGMHHINTKSDYNKLLAWLEKPVKVLPDQSKYLIVCILMSIIATTAAVYFFNHLLSADWLTSMIPLVIVSIINSRILKRVGPIAEEIINSTHQNVEILAGYQSLIDKIESEKFHSRMLQRLQSALNQNNYSAAREISKLKNILGAFQHRGTKKEIGSNTLYAIFNILWLLDIYWIILTEKWKNRNSPYLKGWISALSEFEVLNSLAGFHYSNPSFSFPEIKKEPYTIHFETLGHPLINPDIRVSNHFGLNGRGEIAMVTGSNMAGKSTFLRTVGVNLVLAYMGAPCNAKSANVSIMKIFTSMRTQDNLEEGVSSFYAELKRIEQLLKLIEKGQPIFFLLDEMFKGTNSKDRYKGGVSLIKQLSELNAFGIISTHDLELAKLSGNHMNVANYSFKSEIVKSDIIFSYELTRGICRDFNASELMKRSGIKVLPNIDQM